MSKKRYVDTKIWGDPWFYERLNPLDRYLFLYLLTNDKTNIAGIYELSLRTIANETGIDKEELQRMMVALQPKVFYKDSWVVMPNTVKNQNYKNIKVAKGIQTALQSAPEELVSLINFPDDFVHIEAQGKSPRNKLSNAKRFAVLNRDNYTCHYCGAQAPTVRVEVDHKIPIAEGGTNEMDNLVTACDPCNSGKSDKFSDNRGRNFRMIGHDESSYLDSDLDSDSDLDIDSDSLLADKPPVKVKTVKPKAEKEVDVVSKAYYDTIKLLELPIRNHNNLRTYIKRLKDEVPEPAALKYLDFVATMYPQLTDNGYKPRLDEALDIYVKRVALKSWIERQMVEQKKPAEAGGRPLF